MKPVTAIAVSGGIDSLTAGYFLKKQGHDVIGIHFLTGYEPRRPSAADNISLIAEQLDIPCHILDLRAEFKKRVVTYFTRTYRAGRTPNPCMVCNAAIKFGTVFDFAQKLGASRLATGHYARITKDHHGKFHLLKGVDASKDQSYFLARLKQTQLSKALFPLGDMTKKAVKKLAAEKGLSAVTRQESQDICFIKGCTYGEFLAQESKFKPKAGLIEDIEGNILGEHKGLHLFTVGQRRGINCPASKPYYVLRIDRKRNRLVVGFKKDLISSGCRVIDLNWINLKPLLPLSAHTRVRYRHQAALSTLSPQGRNAVDVKFNRPQSAITPGQGAVFYRDDEVLGGGWIA